MTTRNCLFCDFENPEKHTVIAKNDLAYARWDNYPVSDGHTEVIPKRHIDSFFDLQADELTAIFGLATIARDLIVARYKPDGFNIGINDNEAAGRTIHHLHVHLIPRYIGDVEIPGAGCATLYLVKEIISDMNSSSARG